MPGVEVSTPLTELGLDLPLSWLEASIMMVMILLLLLKEKETSAKSSQAFCPLIRGGF